MACSWGHEWPKQEMKKNVRWNQTWAGNSAKRRKWNAYWETKQDTQQWHAYALISLTSERIPQTFANAISRLERIPVPNQSEVIGMHAFQPMMHAIVHEITLENPCASAVQTTCEILPRKKAQYWRLFSICCDVTCPSVLLLLPRFASVQRPAIAGMSVSPSLWKGYPPRSNHRGIHKVHCRNGYEPGLLQSARFWNKLIPDIGWMKSKITAMQPGYSLSLPPSLPCLLAVWAARASVLKNMYRVEANVHVYETCSVYWMVAGTLATYALCLVSTARAAPAAPAGAQRNGGTRLQSPQQHDPVHPPLLPQFLQSPPHTAAASAKPPPKNQDIAANQVSRIAVASRWAECIEIERIEIWHCNLSARHARKSFGP